MFNNPSFFAKPGQPGRHAIQGRLGNCWFLSAIATVGTVPRLIEQICVSVSRVDFSLCGFELTFGHRKMSKSVFMGSFFTWTGVGWTLSLTSKLYFHFHNSFSDQRAGVLVFSSRKLPDMKSSRTMSGRSISTTRAHTSVWAGKVRRRCISPPLRKRTRRGCR
jgi:hypothetical protein